MEPCKDIACLPYRTGDFAAYLTDEDDLIDPTRPGYSPADETGAAYDLVPNAPSYDSYLGVEF